MRIKLKVHLTGTRNGAEWPGYNEEIELPDQEARDMIAAGMAEAIGDGHKVEKVAETRQALVPQRTLKGRAK